MLFADQRLFCAHAVSTRKDPDLPDGDHLRVLAAAELGPPIAPYAVWRTLPSPDGVPVEAAGGPLSLPLPTAARRIVGVTAPLAQGKLTLAVQDDEGIEIGRSSGPVWEVAAPVVAAATASHAGPVLLMPADAGDFPGWGRGDPLFLRAPVEGACAWYAGGCGVAEAMARVEAGAPKRLSALDRPTGPYSNIPSKAELGRIDADRAKVDSLLEALLRADDTPPARRTLPFGAQAPDGPPDPGEDPLAGGEQPLAEALLLSTVDPGFARYAGSALSLPQMAMLERRESFYWVVGLFAVDDPQFEQKVEGPGFLDVVVSALARPVLDDDEKAMVAHFVKAIPGLADVIKRAQGQGLTVRPLMTLAYCVRPPDYLAAPKVELGSAAWIGEEAGPATGFRQNFRFPGLPSAAAMAMSRSLDGGPFQSRAEPLTTKAPAPATVRRRPVLAGRDADGTAIASDAPVPAGEGAIRYRFAFSDLWGRYGRSSTAKVPVPARPKPPAPHPLVEVERVGLPPADTTELSPGTLAVTVPVPAPDALATGARPIAALKLAFAGQVADLPAAAPQVVHPFALPKLAPQAVGSWPLTATFTDDAGTVSATATVPVTVADNRPPPAVKPGPGIVWTSRPGPAPEVELNLGVALEDSPDTAAFRAYLVDARAMGAEGATRAEAALDGCSPGKAGPDGGRSLAMLLTDPPVPRTGGFTRLSATLPRSLAGVAFLKVVPMTARGVEAPFEQCGFVGVAVPTDRKPPPPRLSGRVLPDGQGAELLVEATGLDMGALEAAEPGLFGPAPGDPLPPEYRLRRASGPVRDPLYARRTGAGPLLIQPGATPSAAATVTEAGLAPFVPCTWWAEVRMPAERRLPPGTQEVPAPAGLRPEFEEQARDMPAPYSSLSAPLTLVPVPADPPAALADAAVTVEVKNATPFNFLFDHRTLKVALADAPVAPAGAVGAFRLLVWAQWGDDPVPSAEVVVIDAAPFQWEKDYGIKGKLASLSLAVMDPLGRIGPPLTRTFPAE